MIQNRQGLSSIYKNRLTVLDAQQNIQGMSPTENIHLATDDEIYYFA